MSVKCRHKISLYPTESRRQLNIKEQEVLKSSDKFVSEKSKSPSGGGDQRFLTFTMGNEAYAVPLAKVREVIAHGDITRVPNTPAHFKGLMNLRGQVISVIDLRTKFQFKNAEISAETAIIILDLDPLCMGVIIDSVDAVLAISEASISPPPDFESNIRSDYITGVARVDKRLILILDIEKTLSVEDLLALKSSASHRQAS